MTSTSTGSTCHLTVMPTPPTKASDDPEHDDRITQMLHHIRPGPPIGVRELVVQKFSTPAAHESEDMPALGDLLDIYEVDEALATSELKDQIVVVDDVLATGQPSLSKTLPRRADRRIVHRT